MVKKKKGQKPSHPWRLWIPKDQKKDELKKGEKIPHQHRMGIRL